MSEPEPAPKRRKRPYHRKRRKGRSTAPDEHRPVLLQETLTVLDPRAESILVDCTLGFAGHSSELLKRLGPTGRLLCLDLDGCNLARAEAHLTEIGGNFAARQGNFAGLSTILAAEGIERIDGLLADLGMSSMQVDDPERGFSFMRDGPIDMRMDRSRGKTAAELLNSLPQEELAAAFRDFGDEPMAEAIAAAIVQRRQAQPIEKTLELRGLIETAAPVEVLRGPGRAPARKQMLLPATRVFQSLRILVNRELANLAQLLRVLPHILKPGGVAAIISFHSGEDRLVKTSFREGLRTGIYAAASDDPIRPSEQEKLDNPRARSAKLRWAKLAPESK